MMGSWTTGRELTAILPRTTGRTRRVRDALLRAGYAGCALYPARGAGQGVPLDGDGVPLWQEVDVLVTPVAEAAAEDAFALAVTEAGIDEGLGGIVVLSRPLGRVAGVSMPPDPRGGP